ncbi:MAG: hypothetical protein PUC30_09565 [Lachnospiraceae bacterium]|nr:hypothetical protein [Lachnospiraceae bacterium]
MKRRKHFGGYFLFLVRETLFRIKELWGWRGIAMIFTIAYMLIDTFESQTGAEIRSLTFQGIGAIWMILIFPPRMGKLLYLLPFSVKERMRYLRTYSVTYLSFFVMIFIFLGGIIFLISGYPYLLWVRSFVFCTFPFLMLYSGIVVKNISDTDRRQYPASGWFFSTRGCWQQEQDNVSSIKEDCRGAAGIAAKKAEKTEGEEKKEREKQGWFMAFEVTCSIIPLLQCCGNWMFTGLYRIAPWTFYVGGVLAYVSAIAGLIIYWNRISEQLKRKGNTGKEECVCNL